MFKPSEVEFENFCEELFETKNMAQSSLTLNNSFSCCHFSNLNTLISIFLRQQKMQQRPPQFFGRCDLETLMGSSSSNVQIGLGAHF